MDSVTRFCLALREIGLSAGEPPATRGYPPSVFAELPRLLERAGPGLERPDGRAARSPRCSPCWSRATTTTSRWPTRCAASSTAISCWIAGSPRAGRYPAVDVLRSLSRAVPGCNAPEENALSRRARALLALHADMADMVRLGAYRAGSDPAVDEAVALAPRIEAMLRQERDDAPASRDSFACCARHWSRHDARSAWKPCCGCAGWAADEARRGLAECLRIESEAAAAVAAIEAAIERETEAATSLAAGDAEVEGSPPGCGGIRPEQRAAAAAEAGGRGGDGAGPLCWPRRGRPCGRPRRCWKSTLPAAEAEAQRRVQSEIDEVAQRRGNI